MVKAYDNGTSSTEEDPPMTADYIIIPSADDMKIHWKNYGGAVTNATLFNKWRNLISVEQTTPNMDYVCECQGRIWGCRYGDTVTDELRQYRKSYGTSYASVQYIDIIKELGKDESFGEYLTYWAYDNDFVRKKESDGVTVSVVNEGAPSGTHYPCIKVEVSGYTGTLNVNVNYTINKAQKLNEIYASRQQDFKSWNYYQATALDSYTVSIGASGQFTGAINFNGKPLFSKEDRIYLIYGNYPAQYQLSENIFEGVEDGAYKSMVVYNGVLYYKGRHGIYAYSGSLPQKIDKFGNLRYSNTKSITDSTRVRVYSEITHMYYWTTETVTMSFDCTCAGAYNGFYYINLENTNYGGIYIYDIDKGIWNRLATSIVPIQMVACKDRIYAMCMYLSGTTLKSDLNAIEKDNATSTTTYTWYAETGTLGLSSPDEKYFEKITIRYKGSATIKINYDSETDNNGTVWNTVTTVSGGTKSQTYAINPKRCDHFRLRFEGSGEFYLYSIAITTETGSDVTNG